jgi:ferredoxin
MKKILLIGTGPSGWAVLNSIPNLEGLWVIDGGAEIELESDASSKHLGVKEKFGSSHSYGRVDSNEVIDDSSYALPLSYSRGGFGEVWGRGFTPYDIAEYSQDNPFRSLNLYPAMKRILAKLPYLHSASHLDSRFGVEELWGESRSSTHVKLHPFFAEILKKGSGKATDDKILIGTPNQFLDSTKCTGCTLCLSGCPYGALFDPGEEVNKLILAGKLPKSNVLRGKVVRIYRKENVNVVEYTKDKKVFKVEFDEVIISAGPLSTLFILMKSQLLPSTFQLPDSQVFYSALFSMKRIRSAKNLPEMGQLSIHPRAREDFDFQLSLYTPSKTSQNKISKTIFGESSLRIKIPRWVTDHLIPIIGFLPQEASGYLRITMRGDSIIVNRVNNNESPRIARHCLAKVRKSFLKMGLLGVPFSLRIPDAGAGFHLGASLPLASKFLDEFGYLKSNPTIRIMDASILPKIPAGGHTFLTMSLIDSLMREQVCES